MNAVSLGADYPIGMMAPQETLLGVRPGDLNKPADEAGVVFIKKLTGRLDREDLSTRRMFYRKWFKVAMFYEGKHLGRWSEATGQYRSYQPQQGDPYYIINEFRYHADAITSQWVQAKFDIRVLPSNDQEETIYKARCASRIVDHYEDVILTEDFNQREGKFGQECGNMFRYTYWDSSKGPKVKRQQFGEAQQIPLGGGYLECEDCGSVAEPGLEMCPECGSPNLTEEPGAEMEMPEMEEGEETTAGDVACEIVSPFQVWFDMSQADFSKAQWLQRKRMLRPEFVRQVIPWWKPTIKNPTSQEHSVRAERMLQRSSGIGDSPGLGMTNEHELGNGIIVTQWWLCPSMYAARGPEPEAILFGADGLVRIDAGERLVDVFPTGMYLLIIDDKIVDVREEYLHDHWQHTPFIQIPTRALGDGMEDLLEPQRQLGDMNSLVYIDAKANAAPPTLINTTMGLKTDDIVGKPHWNVPIRVPLGESIDNGVRLIQGRAMPGHVFAYINSLKGSMQILAKSFSSSTGAPDVADLGGVNTATGAQLMSSNAVAQRGPELALRAAGNVVWARQVLKLFKENATDAHYIPMQGRYGAMEGAYFKGSDVDADFIITVRKRSWMPRNEFERRQDLLGAMEAGLINPQLPRPIRDAIAEHFNIDIDIISDSADLRIARMRLEKMKQLDEMLTQQGAPPEILPQLLLMEVPMEPLSDDMLVQREWYVDWLKRDEGLMASPTLRQAVNGRLLEMDNAMSMEMARQQALQIQAMGPQLQMQGAMEGHAAAQREEASAVQHDRQMQMTSQKEKSKPQSKSKPKE